MILAKNDTAQYYKGIHPNLDTALELISDDFFATLGTERVDIIPGKIWCTAFGYDTIPDEESFFEAHEKFLDIHIMLSGSERVEIASPKNLEVFRSEAENDFWGYRGKGDYSLILSPVLSLWSSPTMPTRSKCRLAKAKEFARLCSR